MNAYITYSGETLFYYEKQMCVNRLFELIYDRFKKKNLSGTIMKTWSHWLKYFQLLIRSYDDYYMNTKKKKLAFFHLQIWL